MLKILSATKWISSAFCLNRTKNFSYNRRNVYGICYIGNFNKFRYCYLNSKCTATKPCYTGNSGVLGIVGAIPSLRKETIVLVFDTSAGIREVFKQGFFFSKLI